MYVLKRWDDQDTFYIQTNNPTEEILRKEGAKEFRVACGPTAAVNGLAARGDKVTIECPGRYYPQPDEVATDWFHDPVNYPLLKKIRENMDPSEWMGNEVPQYYPAMILDVFGVPAQFRWGCEYKDICAALDHNKAVMLCLKNPGHWICVVVAGAFKPKIIYRDTWPNNPWPSRLKGTSGFNRELVETDFVNFKPYRVEIGG